MQEQVAEKGVPGGVGTRTVGARKFFSRTRRPVARSGSLTKHTQTPCEHHLRIERGCLRFRRKPVSLETAGSRRFCGPFAHWNLQSREPVTRDFEPLRSRASAEAEEGGFIQIQPRAALMQPADEPVAPACDAERVAVTRTRHREPGKPRAAYRDVVELLFQNRQHARKRGDELRERICAEAMQRGERSDHSPGSRACGFAEPALQIANARRTLRGAALCDCP